MAESRRVELLHDLHRVRVSNPLPYRSANFPLTVPEEGLEPPTPLATSLYHHYTIAGCSMRKRTWSDTDLQQAIQANQTLAGVFRQLGLSTSPGNYTFIHGHIRRLGLDTSHMLGHAHLRGKPHKHKGVQELKDILVEGSHCGGPRLRKRLLKEGFLVEACAECGQRPEWNGRPLTLQLDHINGNHLDNRLANLRILCPNCHTQTETFTSRKGTGRYAVPAQDPYPRNTCPCGTKIRRRSTHCEACRNRMELHIAKYKIQWPAREVLLQMLSESNYLQVGKQLGVSDNAVRKHLRRVPTVGNDPTTPWSSAMCSTI